MKKPVAQSAISLPDLNRYLASNNLDDDIESIRQSLVDFLESKVREVSKQKKNRERIRKNDEAKDSQSAVKVLSESEIAKLPRWVRAQIDSSVIIGKSGDVIQVPDGRKFHRKNNLNDLSGGEWTYFLNSVINTRYPTSGSESYAHDLRKIHPSPKPPQLMQNIIEFFTKEGEIVFDYFMGVGGTLLGASLANRRALGVDLNENYIEVYGEAAKSLGLKLQPVIHGDSIELLKEKTALTKKLKGENISLVLIDPPYGDMMSRTKTGEATKKKSDNSPTPYSTSDLDLGNMSLPEFFQIFRESVDNAMAFIKPKGHVVVFMKDLQPSKESPNLLHSQVIDELTSSGKLQYLGMKIWADQGVNLYPYGYPYAFVSNQIHQFILIFRKV